MYIILFLNYILCTDYAIMLFLIIFYAMFMLWFWSCYYSCLDFTPAPATEPCHSLRTSPRHCSCPWVMHISSLATPFPILYFISPCLFCNYPFVLVNPLTSLPIPPYAPPIWQPSKSSPYPWFCLCSSCLLSLFYRFNCWWICIYFHFIVHSFDLLLFIK